MRPALIIRVECQQLIDRSGRSGSYTGKLNQETQLPHGWGRMEYNSCASPEDRDGLIGNRKMVVSYDGQWVAGDWTGYGKVVCQTSSYEGTFLDNRKHGFGVLTYKADGRVYDGQFRFDKITGKGKMTYQDGTTYWGYLSTHELPHGRGKLTKIDGTVYDGEFDSGRFEGHGRITYPDGRWYLGEVTDGTPNGVGLEVESDGSLCHEGTFYNGRPVRSSSFPLQRQSSATQLLYRSRAYGNSRSLVGPLPRHQSMTKLCRARSA